MVEFAYSALGLNPHFGTPGNATDPALIPGGSSSGAGVTVAEGTSEISIGSDTGGSIRIPAALNGVVGFKPTARRVPLKGAFPLSYTLDSVGPLARSVSACADADAILAGEAPVPLRIPTLRGLRIGIPRGRLFGEIEPAVATSIRCGRARLGHERRADFRFLDRSPAAGHARRDCGGLDRLHRGRRPSIRNGSIRVRRRSIRG